MLGATAGLAALPFAGNAALAQVVSPMAGEKVYIDPGHGGDDRGASANGVVEKNVTLDIAKRLREILDRHGYNVRMSRSTDITRSLSYRVNDANSWGASIFVSIHCNAGGGYGFESYRDDGAVSDRTVRLQNNVHARVIAWMNKDQSVTDRGKKAVGFYVVENTNMSAVLTENLFVDNVANANLLKSAAFRQDVALGHYHGINNFFN
ncbi:N-acetylmuramoyl-L-alanine amidase family protein [Glycomyces harbinensis]|uniref:N-acetylmuramoyl-L-alanine amidase family protein n=1 Tax=Glycomyces harbinensis TaxID=58114 RepID=UPI001FDEB235|nr:N-acetylmuramoyl-L-alanine amidase [Glycomyces harbinensis]